VHKRNANSKGHVKLLALVILATRGRPESDLDSVHLFKLENSTAPLPVRLKITFAIQAQPFPIVAC
jgi:hypothetical protein